MLSNSENKGRFFLKDDSLIPSKDFNIHFLYEGVNVYEVIRITDGIPLFIDDHCARFYASLKGKEINFHCNTDIMKEKVHILIQANKLTIGNIKIVYHFTDQRESFLILYPIEYYYPDKEEYKKGVSCALLNEERPDPTLKNWRPAFKEKIKKLRDLKGVYEIILVSENNIITEGSQSNLFFVEKNKIITAKAERVLAGITRKYVFSICNANGIEIIERDFKIDDIRGFDCAFLSGTSPKILPVRYIEDIKFNPHNFLLSKLMIEYNSLIEKYIWEFKHS